MSEQPAEERTVEYAVANLTAAMNGLMSGVGFILDGGGDDWVELKLDQATRVRIVQRASEDAEPAVISVFVRDLAGAVASAEEAGVSLGDLELTGRWRERRFAVDPQLHVRLAFVPGEAAWLTDDLEPDGLVYRFDLPGRHTSFTNDPMDGFYGDLHGRSTRREYGR